MRNTDPEEDLCDQLFNHSEDRLARVLLKLARMREHDVLPDAKIPVFSHETLAEMVGTTRSRITHFMNKFRTMGLLTTTTMDLQQRKGPSLKRTRGFLHDPKAARSALPLLGG
jgi:Crp-like helix-turn-helix domain